MQTKYEFPKNAPSDYQALLIELGVHEDSLTFPHYAFRSGNPEEALAWVNIHFPDALLRLKDKDGRTPIHYAVWSGNPETLAWIKSHFPKAF